MKKENETVGHEEVQFEIGQIFGSKDSFKKSVERYAIKEKRNIVFQESEGKRVSAVCVEEECKWRIYASVNSVSNGKFVVRSYQENHACVPNGKIKLYTLRKIAGTFLKEYRTAPLKGQVIKDRLECIRMSKDKCQRAREICRQLIQEENAMHFSRLYDYCIELQESNPRSNVFVETKDRVFDRFYACFYAQKQGWKNACRRIIHLDGAHLKGRMKGQILSAIGRDANDSMYPIAWSIVEVENKVNWQWFLEKLTSDLEVGEGNRLTLVSDQQKGLIGAIELVCPLVEHRMCARHIWANFRKKHGESPLLYIQRFREMHGHITSVSLKMPLKIFRFYDRMRMPTFKSIQPIGQGETPQSLIHLANYHTVHT